MDKAEKSPDISINDWSRKRLWRFCVIWVVGILSYCIYISNYTIFTIPDIVLIFIRFSTYIILPRSILELGSNEESFGQIYFQGAILFEFITALLSLFSLTWCTIEFMAKETSFTRLTTKEWWTAAMVSVVLIFRPAFAHDTSVFSNTIDASGVYFIREGIIIPISYYFLTKIILDYVIRKKLNKRQAEDSYG